MPDSGHFEERPRKESVDIFVKYLKSNPVVEDVIVESECRLIVRRKSKADLRVYLTNTYVLGDADVHEIFSEDPNIDAIVTMSQWNGYSESAKLNCKGRGVGLFKFGEFLGAVYYEGEKFLDYSPPSDEEREARRGRRWR
jgi:hypothetical protein